MSEQAFWQHLKNLGGLQHGWWYHALATPAVIVAVVAILSVVFAGRHIERKLSLFLLHTGSCVPLLLIVPSFFVALQPQQAIAYSGFQWPEAASELPRQSAQTLSLYLGVLAQLGITGGVVGLMVGLGGLTISASSGNVPVISSAARQITQVVRDSTQRFRRNRNDSLPQPGASTFSSPYGRLTVLTEPHVGTQFAVRPGNTVGRKECDIVISNSIVSKKHAQLDVDDRGQTTIVDQGSANGLFVYRVTEIGDDQKHDLGAVSGEPFTLRPGDVIALGDPDHPEDGAHAVKLRFDHEFR